MYDQNTSIEHFLSVTAARQPIPGGGSVSALAGALASAIGEMVLNYSIGRKDLLAFEPVLKNAVRELQLARALLLRLMVEDQLAYTNLTSTRKLPVDAHGRDDLLAEAVLACIRGPQAVGATAVAVLRLCNDVVEIVNPYLLSDLAVSAELAMATARSAMYNVRVNLSSVANTLQRQTYEKEIDQILQHAKSLIQRVIPQVWARHERAARK